MSDMAISDEQLEQFLTHLKANQQKIQVGWATIDLNPVIAAIENLQAARVVLNAQQELIGVLEKRSALLTETRAMLQRLQYEGRDEGRSRECPLCGSLVEYEGKVAGAPVYATVHEPNCELAALLARVPI